RGGDEAAFGRRAALVVVELPADLPAGVGAEQAGDLGLVLEGLTDRARGGVLAGFDRRRRRGDLNRLIGAAGGGFLVVLVARVGSDPVVGAGLRGARALRRCVLSLHDALPISRGGDEAAFGRRAALVVV